MSAQEGVSGRLRQQLYEILEDEEATHPARRWVHRALAMLIVGSVLAAVLDTVASIRDQWDGWLRAVEYGCIALFTIEYAVRVWVAVEDRAGRYEHPLRGRLRYMATPMALIDLLAILPTYLALIVPGDFLLLRTLRILRILKITRYSPALATFEVVLFNERRSLMAAGTILAVALLLAAGALHHVEGEAQPENFGSIPAAMWWAIATLTTVGYGDVVPITPLGRMLAGVVAVVGIGMFALPTAILGAGFAYELNKRNFAATAAMVARVPLFRHLGPAQLAELTALLRPRRLPPRYTVMRRGEHPDSMYFIDEGQVVARHPDRRTVLSPGSFFGELALIEGRPRQVSIITLTTCRLLELQASDFHRLLAGDPQLRQAILDDIAKRYPQAARRPAEATPAGPVPAPGPGAEPGPG
ncbi:MAG: cyclic nucleotide-gated ion channel [Geminicoccaceae bacterium]